jgi:hypothetical protein
VISSYLILGNYVAKVLEFTLGKQTFGHFYVEVICLQQAQYHSEMFQMQGKQRVVDQTIVHKDQGKLAQAWI